MGKNEGVEEKFSENKPINRKRRKLLLISLFFAIFAITIIILALDWSSRQVIKSVKIVGNKIIPGEEIRKMVGDSILKLPNDKIKLNAIERKLSSHPFILETFVTHLSTDELQIEIKERQPIAVLVDNEGSLNFLDEQGYTLPYRLFESFADLPLLRNVYFGDRLNKSALTGCMNFLKILRENSFRLIGSCISEIVYDSTDGTFSMQTTGKGIKIFFGKPQNIEEKLFDLLVFWNAENPLAENSMVKYIDLRWFDSVVVG